MKYSKGENHKTVMETLRTKKALKFHKETNKSVYVTRKILNGLEK